MPALKVEDRKESKTIRIRKSLDNRLKAAAKLHKLKQIDIITRGIELYIELLEKGV
jgi:hypothetical protein